MCKKLGLDTAEKFRFCQRRKQGGKLETSLCRRGISKDVQQLLPSQTSFHLSLAFAAAVVWFLSFMYSTWCVFFLPVDIAAEFAIKHPPPVFKMEEGALSQPNLPKFLLFTTVDYNEISSPSDMAGEPINPE
jgi:hypothetical protein